MSIRDIQLAAREHLMAGLQVQLSRMADMTQEDGRGKRIDPIVLENAIRDFRRIEKFLGFDPGSWMAGS